MATHPRSAWNPSKPALIQAYPRWRDPMSTRRKRRLKFLLRPRPKPAGTLPEPGELERHQMPKEQRPQGRMFWRTKQERLPMNIFSPRRYPVLWGSYTFDNLFRLALGMFLGYLAAYTVFAIAGVANTMPRRAPTEELMAFQLARALPPLLVLIAFAFHWRRKQRIRQAVGPWGAVFGCMHCIMINFAVIPVLVMQ